MSEPFTALRNVRRLRRAALLVPGLDSLTRADVGASSRRGDRLLELD